MLISFKDEPTKFWRQISHLSGKNFDGVLSDVCYSAGEFNKYFLSIASDIAANLTITTMHATFIISDSLSCSFAVFCSCQCRGCFGSDKTVMS